jgi:hypothetical protein
MILSQYKEFKDVFEKIFVDTLLEHYPYDCIIDLEEGSKPPFKHIHNLSQDELVAFLEYIDENLRRGSFSISNILLVPLSSLSRRRMVPRDCV